MAALVFEHVGNAEPNFANNAVALAFLGADKKRYNCEIALSCVPATIAAMVAAAGQLVAKLPADKRPQLQPLVIKSFQQAMADTGDLAVIATLENGVELALQFGQGDLAGLAEMFSELARMANRQMRH